MWGCGIGDGISGEDVPEVRRRVWRGWPGERRRKRAGARAESNRGRARWVGRQAWVIFLAGVVPELVEEGIPWSENQNEKHGQGREDGGEQGRRSVLTRSGGARTCGGGLRWRHGGGRHRCGSLGGGAETLAGGRRGGMGKEKEADLVVVSL